MDPVCTVCGATTDLVGRPEAGWVCAISGPCLQRSARAIMGELRAEDPTFGMPSDIHPTGRCTCGGEGRCAWCSRPCPACGVPTIEHGDTCISMQRACSRCGGLENVLLLVHGWVCDFCLGGDRMPEYEALGYPETGFGECDLDHAAYLIGFASRGIAVVSIQRELDAIQKDIRSSSDIVDSSAKDSYK